MNANQIRSFLRNHAADKARLAVMQLSPSVGCMLGFRNAAVNSSDDELLSLRVGEDAKLVQALIHNGAHPDYQNGKAMNPRYRRMLARQASEERANVENICCAQSIGQSLEYFESWVNSRCAHNLRAPGLQD